MTKNIRALSFLRPVTQFTPKRDHKDHNSVAAGLRKFQDKNKETNSIITLSKE
jgi:hypothetical protein